MKVEELHFSRLKNMARSPAHFRAAILEPSEPSPAMKFGTLVHSLALGGEFVVYDGDRRGKAWTEFSAAHEGTLIVTAKEHERAKRVAEAVLTDPVAAPLLDGEREIEWKARLYGRACGGRVDVYKRAAHLVDLKTTTDAHPDRFQYAALRLAYHAQMSFYRDALGHNGAVYLVAVEVTSPFAVTVMRLTERALDEGAKMNRLWVERLNVCEATDEWPAYCQSPVPLDVVEDDELTFGNDAEAAE